MENQSGDWTRLLYCTTGVLLRKLQHDRHLTSLTHIIVDEVLTAMDAFLLILLLLLLIQHIKLHPLRSMSAVSSQTSC